MLSILVAHSYFVRFDQKQSERAKPYPPLATLQVASTLRVAGHAVSVFDAMLADGPAAFSADLDLHRPQVVLLYEDTFNFLSKMCLGRMRRAGCQMIAAARQAGCRVIVAGPDATDEPDAYLGAGAEMVLIGEGLSALALLVARLDADAAAPTGDLVAGLSGIAHRGRGGSHAPKAGELLPWSKQAPQPAWDLIDIERYRSVWVNAHGYFSLNMAASRGCSFRCNWCAKPTWGHHYLQRNPEEVAAEMAYLRHQFEPDHIWFADDVFGFRVDWVMKFAAAVHARNGSVPFTIQTRADLLSSAMTSALRSANCREVWIGAESGSQRILDAMNKGTTVQQIAQARRRLREEGIRVGFFIQLGYLGEQLDDILATRDLIRQAAPDDIGVSVSYPLPGTKFYELVRTQLQSKTHWQQSNDLDMMFQGTYKTQFYHAVRDLLHAEVATRDDLPLMQSLQRRWDLLLSNEPFYRNTAAGDAALAPVPAHGA